MRVGCGQPKFTNEIYLPWDGRKAITGVQHVGVEREYDIHLQMNRRFRRATGCRSSWQSYRPSTTRRLGLSFNPTQPNRFPKPKEVKEQDCSDYDTKPSYHRISLHLRTSHLPLEGRVADWRSG